MDTRCFDPARSPQVCFAHSAALRSAYLSLKPCFLKSADTVLCCLTDADTTQTVVDRTLSEAADASGEAVDTTLGVLQQQETLVEQAMALVQEYY